MTNYIILRNINLLTFDTEIMIWAIFKDVNYIKILDGTFSVKNDDITEKDLIESFKFLNLNKSNFKNFLKNKKIGYRYINHDARKIFWQKYQANSLKTFNNSKNFDESLKNFILNTSPLYMEQLAIPKEEFERLRKKFLQKNTFKFKEPDLIIFNKFEDTLIFKRAIVDTDKFCILINNNSYMVYIKNNKIKL